MKRTLIRIANFQVFRANSLLGTLEFCTALHVKLNAGTRVINLANDAQLKHHDW